MSYILGTSPEPRSPCMSQKIPQDSNFHEQFMLTPYLSLFNGEKRRKKGYAGSRAVHGSSVLIPSANPIPAFPLQKLHLGVPVYSAEKTFPSWETLGLMCSSGGPIPKSPGLMQKL